MSTVINRFATILFVVYVALLCTPTLAAPCSLTEVASLDLTRQANGDYTVPVTLGDGKARPFSLEFASPLSWIDGQVAHDLGFRQVGFGSFVEFKHHDRRFRGRVIVPSLKIGQAVVGESKVPVSEGDADADEVKIGGALGDDILSLFDVELDLAAGKMNLFSQNHCPGKVVYWARAYEKVPIAILGSPMGGTFALPIQVDGKVIEMQIDIDLSTSAISRIAAHTNFGLSPDSPGMIQPKDIPKWAEGESLRAYHFNNISVGNVSAGAATLYVTYGGNRLYCYFVSSVVEGTPTCPELGQLGSEQLRALHLYIAFGEKAVYVTPASPTHAAAAAMMGSAQN